MRNCIIQLKRLGAVVYEKIATECNREMKYNINSPIPRSWNHLTLVKFKSEVCNKLISKKTLCEEGYDIDQFNLLSNAEIILEGQIPR